MYLLRTASNTFYSFPFAVLETINYIQCLFYFINNSEKFLLLTKKSQSVKLLNPEDVWKRKATSDYYKTLTLETPINNKYLNLYAEKLQTA